MTIPSRQPHRAPASPKRPEDHRPEGGGPSDVSGPRLPSNIARAWLVHLYTASGALAAFFGTVAVFEARYRDSLLLMMFATCVDATDGLLARRARVTEVLQTFDGARLDDIVDYLTFVFVPAFIVHGAGLLPDGPVGFVVVAAVLLSSAYGFNRDDAKTADYFFTGFPSYWNIVAVYMVALRLTPELNAAILLGLAAMVFVPIGYVYPSRTPQLREVTVSLGVVWGALVVWLILALPDPPRWLAPVSLLYPAYYVLLSFYLHARRRR
jgi:phosphatidylcholine synthase